MNVTWKPHEKHGELTERGDLPDSVFAYPRERKEPLTDASHVRNAIARFDQVAGVSDDERDLAFANIKAAAEHYEVAMSESEWSELGRRPSTGGASAGRKTSARKAAATREREGTGTGTTPARKRGAKRAAATRKKPATTKNGAAKKPAAKKTTRAAAKKTKRAAAKKTKRGPNATDSTKSNP